jgi:hypothetical protein
MATQSLAVNGKTGIPIIDSLRRIEPDKNIAITAVGKLNNRADIVRFYDSYVEYLKKYGDSSEKQNPNNAAKENLLAATGYYSSKTRTKWNSVLEEIGKSEYSSLLRQ